MSQFRGQVRLLAIVAVFLVLGSGVFRSVRGQGASKGGTSQNVSGEDPTAAARNRMVDRHLVERGIKNKRVLEAFRTVPRHRFLPPKTHRLAYDDESIPIGEGQTITPPYDVAFMTEVLDPKPTDRVYEVGISISDPVSLGQGGLLDRDPCPSG